MIGFPFGSSKIASTILTVPSVSVEAIFVDDPAASFTFISRNTLLAFFENFHARVKRFVRIPVFFAVKSLRAV
jgi:hypothetical protein